MRLQVVPAVADDIARAGRWYNRRLEGLGEDFANEAYDFIDEIVANPTVRRKVYQDFRRGFAERFPYATYYRIHEDVVVILLVIHTARNPNTVKRLLRQRGR